MPFTAIKQTTSSYDKTYPQHQVVGDKVYVAWLQNSPSRREVWLAVMNLDGTGFTPIQLTSGGTTDKTGLQFQVSGSKIYFVWHQPVGAYTQIFTAEMNLDGTGWSAAQRTTSNYNKSYPQLQVVGDWIYYVWFETDASGKTQIWTAFMNLDGSGFSPVKRTTTGYNKTQCQLQVVGDWIYYVWQEFDSSNKAQIWTAVMSTGGLNWSATRRTSSAYNKYNPQFCVYGSSIYYVWQQYDGTYWQVWTAVMGIDGTGWVATQRTYGADTKYNPQLQVVEDVIHYVWQQYYPYQYQIVTATMNIDGTEFETIQRTNTPYQKYVPQLQVVGPAIYYSWYELDSSYNYQIWTARLFEAVLNVVSTDPLDDAVDIPVESTIEVVFSSSIDTSTVTPSSLIITSASVPGGYAYTTGYNDATKTLAITVTNGLNSNEIITVNITSGIVSTDGAALTPYSFTFTTAALPLSCDPPGILGPDPIRCSKPIVVLQAPNVPGSTPWLLHFKIEAYSDADGTILISATDSSTNPELFEYSVDGGLTWRQFPAAGLAREQYGAQVRARVEVGPRTTVYLRASVGAEAA